MTDFAPLVAPLFVPATRTDRIIKAVQSGTDAIIVDLEDAVPAQDKDTARVGFAHWIKADAASVPVPIYVRINAVGSPWFEDDLAFVQSAGVAGIMLPKTERAEDILAMGENMNVIGLVETAAGIVALPDICGAANLRQLAFGSIDYALDLGCRENRDTLLMARLSLVTQSRAHGLPAPVDGVTVSVTDEELLQSDADYAKGLGFSGKLSIHPRQIEILKAAFHPSEDEVNWARSVCRLEKASKGAAILFDGCMIDTPVIEKARRILDWAGQSDAI